jgi:hypothetical protein
MRVLRHNFLLRLNELHVSHMLDVQSTISDFRVLTNDLRLEFVFEAPTPRIYKVVLPTHLSFTWFSRRDLVRNTK